MNRSDDDEVCVFWLAVRFYYFRVIMLLSESSVIVTFVVCGGDTLDILVFIILIKSEFFRMAET